VNQRVAIEMLSTMGFGADAVENGKEALLFLGQNNYDLVIMDCQMPVMDGYEAAREIRKLEKASGGHLPIIAATADATSGDRKKSFEAGMDDYITKPIEFEKFSALVKKWIYQNPKFSSQKPGVTATPSIIAVPVESAATIDWTVLDRMREFQKPGSPDLVKELVDLFLE